MQMGIRMESDNMRLDFTSDFPVTDAKPMERLPILLPGAGSWKMAAPFEEILMNRSPLSHAS